ncbi:hypothetical protein NKH82_23835 [Mesorhizobium sp. M0915]|uniref:P-loop ATPase, Sll1717 family n=1 Tax=unclassified Mesorhizobium TaxID=325217 RepID=UPI0033395CFE
MEQSKFRRAFFAFPSSPADLTRTISSACSQVQLVTSKLTVTPWPSMDVFGDNIPDRIRSLVEKSDTLLCDITFPNMNVYYEMGFAVGSGCSIAPVVNVSFADATKNVMQDGLFDVIGFQTYESSSGLVSLFTKLPSTSLLDLYGKPVNASQPLFLIDPLRKTDFRNSIVSSIKGSKVFYRSHDPVESPRFSVIAMIGEATSSSGIIVPFLGANVDDAPRHNLRASFLAGLCHGLGRETLLIQQDSTGSPIPLDYREAVTTVRNEEAIEETVSQFAKAAIIAIQGLSTHRNKPRRSDLQRVSLGASAAENEFRTLENYFVETSEYVRTLRGELGIVAGRKGSGKTAIFFMVRDTTRTQKNFFVTDLKPESHQLSLFRQELLKLVEVGVFDHTLAAFWYFVFLSETLFTIRRGYEHRLKFDGRSVAILTEIDAALDRYEIVGQGDFTSRINLLSRHLLQEIAALKRSGQALSPERLTNIVFRGGINQIKALVAKYTDQKSRMLVLFDNIDKGWPANGVQSFDIRMVRLMIETLDKIRRDFAGIDRDFASVVFLRNDIYELLVEDTPDRGKGGQIRIDWTDRAKLRQVIFKRLQSSQNNISSSFQELWQRTFCDSVGSRDSFEYCVDHCLMRPRFLINIVENSLANAINRGNGKVTETDIVDAVRQHANLLVEDFGYEIRDVSGLSADILFAFIGQPKFLTKDKVLDGFRAFGLDDDQSAEAFRLMLWYGVLGFGHPDGREKYIYDYEYSLKRLLAEARMAGSDAAYAINDAIHISMV